MSEMTGKAIKFGDNINTDIISPPQYMELSIEEASKYSMSAVRPNFYEEVREQNILVAGNNLGSGSSRETSPLTLKYLGVQVIIAKFFARIFYRNCINVGIAAVECADTDRIDDGDELAVDIAAGTIRNLTKGEEYTCTKIPAHLMNLINEGGLVPHLKNRFSAAENGTPAE